MTNTIYIIALIIAGLLFLGLEFITPTFGVLAFFAVASFIGAIWLGFTISPLAGVLLIVGLLIGVPLWLLFVVRFLPKSPLSRKLFLKQAPKEPGAGIPESDKYNSLVGKIGTAETTLRPTGAVRVDGERIIASAESDMIEDGAQVKVIEASSMNIVVREVTE